MPIFNPSSTSGVTVVAYGKGSTTEVAQTDISTFTETAGCNAETGIYRIDAFGVRTGSGTGITIPNITINDGTNTITLNPGAFDAFTTRGLHLELMKNPASTTQVIRQGYVWNNNPTYTGVTGTTDTVIAAWATTGKTFKLQAQAADTGTSYVTWFVTRSG